MARRERVITSLSAGAFVAVGVWLLTVVPDERSTSPVLILGLLASYVIASRVTFEFGSFRVTPEQLVLVPLLLLAPLPFACLLVGLAVVLSRLHDAIGQQWLRDRWFGALADSWFCVGPVVVLAVYAPGEPELRHTAIYIVAFASQLLLDFVWATARDRLLERLPMGAEVPFREIWRNFSGVARFDALLTPIAFAVTLVAVDAPEILLTLAPLVLVLDTFARERQERYAATLELQRAYRGTVMLLSDVVEFDDAYTAEHSRSVVDLVHSVADKLHVESTDRQELEFAALLHDVGKISVPKEIIHKPAKLNDDEWRVMRTHTIEGQLMLDRVGGLLGRVGEVVRSCHERWDGRGYPDGLAGEHIPLAARIVFACDAFNAMTTDRSYRAAMSTAEAVAEISANSGTQFDPRVAAALIDVAWEYHGRVSRSPADDIRAVLSERPAAPMKAGVGAAL